jgi:dihydrofolate reductase
MRKVIASEFLTLDGVMQAPGEPNEDPSGGFEHSGWARAFFDPVFAKNMLETLSAAGGLLLGRITYEIFAAHWPNQPEQDPVAPIMNELSKFVASTTLREPLAWRRSSLLGSDAAAAVARLKEQTGKDLLLLGSGRLARTLMQRRLIDEYRLMIHPLVLGKGKRLFQEGDAIGTLRLVDSKATSTGVLMVTYQPAS